VSGSTSSTTSGPKEAPPSFHGLSGILMTMLSASGVTYFLTNLESGDKSESSTVSSTAQVNNSPIQSPTESASKIIESDESCELSSLRKRFSDHRDHYTSKIKQPLDSNDHNFQNDSDIINSDDSEDSCDDLDQHCPEFTHIQRSASMMSPLRRRYERCKANTKLALEVSSVAIKQGLPAFKAGLREFQHAAELAEQSVEHAMSAIREREKTEQIQKELKEIRFFGDSDNNFFSNFSKFYSLTTELRQTEREMEAALYALKHSVEEAAIAKQLWGLSDEKFERILETSIKKEEVKQGRSYSREQKEILGLLAFQTEREERRNKRREGRRVRHEKTRREIEISENNLVVGNNLNSKSDNNDIDNDSNKFSQNFSETPSSDETSDNSELNKSNVFSRFKNYLFSWYDEKIWKLEEMNESASDAREWAQVLSEIAKTTSAESEEEVSSSDTLNKDSGVNTTSSSTTSTGTTTVSKSEQEHTSSKNNKDSKYFRRLMSNTKGWNVAVNNIFECNPLLIAFSNEDDDSSSSS